MIVGPLFALFLVALIELALRMAGFGYPTVFFIQHPATGPNALVENQRFAWRFMPVTLARRPEPLLISKQKRDGTCRIFVFGESAAIGDPAPAFGFSRILEVLLSERYPETHFEVLNTAFTAINSHVIVPIARHCERLGGDFWLVYMGNNEVIGPFGSGTVFGRQSPPLPVIRTSLAIKKTRIGQLMDIAAQRVVPSVEASKGWGGMDMFLSQHVRRDDPRLATLRNHFTVNLKDIIRTGTKSGARVVVSTMVSNLRDWPPFGSSHREGLTDQQLKEWDKLVALGAKAEEEKDFRSAIRHYAAAARIDDQFAQLHYRWGHCCLALNDLDNAKAHFVLARDFDTLRFRTDSQFNEIIRRTVGARAGDHLSLLDAEKEFSLRTRDGITGREWLHEHVHFNFSGNYVLARLFAEQIADSLSRPLSSTAGPSREWLPENDCAARLALSETQRQGIADLIMRRFDEPIFRQQLGYAEIVKRQQQEVAALRTAAKPVARRRGLDLCRQAIARAPGDWVLHELCARLLAALDEHAAAEDEWLQVARLIPHAAKPYTEIGKLKQQLGRAEEAFGAFENALRLDATAAEAHAGLGIIYSQQGRRSEAIRHLKQALRLDPTRQEAREELSRISAANAKDPSLLTLRVMPALAAGCAQAGSAPSRGR